MNKMCCTLDHPVIRVSNGTETVLDFLVYGHNRSGVSVSILADFIADYLTEYEKFHVANRAIVYKDMRHPSEFKIGLDYAGFYSADPTDFGDDYQYGCLRGPVLRALRYVIDLTETSVSCSSAELDDAKSLASELYEKVSSQGYHYL